MNDLKGLGSSTRLRDRQNHDTAPQAGPVASGSGASPANGGSAASNATTAVEGSSHHGALRGAHAAGSVAALAPHVLPGELEGHGSGMSSGGSPGVASYPSVAASSHSVAVPLHTLCPTHNQEGLGRVQGFHANTYTQRQSRAACHHGSSGYVSGASRTAAERGAAANAADAAAEPEGVGSRGAVGHAGKPDAEAETDADERLGSHGGLASTTPAPRRGPSSPPAAPRRVAGSSSERQRDPHGDGQRRIAGVSPTQAIAGAAATPTSGRIPTVGTKRPRRASRFDSSVQAVTANVGDGTDPESERGDSSGAAKASAAAERPKGPEAATSRPVAPNFAAALAAAGGPVAL